MNKLRLQVEQLEDRCVPASVADLGWTGGPIPIAAAVDQELVSGVAHTGDGSWRMSNAAYGGMYYGFPNSPALSVKAGEGQPADMFAFTVWIAPVGAADGSSIEINAGTIDGDRVTKITVVNSLEDGFGIGIADGFAHGVFVPLSAGWHRLDVTVTFRSGQDTFLAAVDGVGVGEFDTIEAFFADRGDADAHAKVVDRVFFRANYSDPDAVGFYIDDLAYSSRSSSDPSTMLASYETSFNHGGDPEHHLAAKKLTKKEQKALLKQQRTELAIQLMEDEGYGWRKAWRIAGRIQKAGAA